MKKLMMIAAVIAMMMTTTVSVYATATTAGTTWESRINQRITDLQAKKQAISDYRSAAIEKRDIVKANRDDNKAIWEENKTLRQALKVKLAAIKADGTVLDATVITTLKADHEKIKVLVAEIRATEGQIKEYLTLNKGNAKKLDYDALNSTYAKIADVQLLRNTKLVEINNLLKEMTGLLN